MELMRGRSGENVGIILMAFVLKLWGGVENPAESFLFQISTIMTKVSVKIKACSLEY